MENRNSGVFSARTLNLAVILFLLSVSRVFALAPMIEWQKCLGGTDWEMATCIKQTSDGGYIVGGYTYSSNGDVTTALGNEDCWITKLDSDGSIVWQKSLGGSANDNIYSVQQTTDGGYIVAGHTMSNDMDVTGNHGGLDYWIVKLDAVGNIVWQKCYGGWQHEILPSIQQTADGGYIIAGTSSSSDGDITSHQGSSYNDDCWIIKISSTGALEWEKSFGGSGDDRSRGIQTTSDGGYILVGITFSNDEDVSGNHGNTDVWVVKLSTVGAIEWQKCLGGSGWEESSSVVQATDGGYVFSSYSSSTDGDITGGTVWGDYWIVKLSSVGAIEWERSLGADLAGDMATSVSQTTDGGYVVTGSTSGNDGDVSGNHSNNSDYWIVKLSNGGIIEWQKCLGGTDGEFCTGGQQTSDGGYVFVGQTFSIDADISGNHGSADWWVVKLGPQGTPLPIELLSFDAKPTKQNTVDVSWSTTSQVNNHYFDVGRSVDGESWENIYRTNGCGTCQVTMRYYTTDMYPHMGQSYYRLMQTDYDGRNTRGPVVPVKIKSLGRIIVSNISSGWLVSGLSKGMRVVVYDLRGAVMLKQTVDGATFDIDTYSYPQGCYIINVLADNMVFSAKVVK